jgi:muramoyltetrapeptide carboxypeptidase LdcA involved in peptidoglycan recycling
MELKRPGRLKPGDRVALVSLSWGGLGDAKYIHKYEIAKSGLPGIRARARPDAHALMGTEFVAEHPELRARDLADAFLDDSISAVFCAIGGDDSIRILPHVDFDAIRAHPKIFMGYSDTTVGHFIMGKAGLVSFYGRL